MRSLQLWSGVVVVAASSLVACDRADTRAAAERTGDTARVTAERASEELADGWLTAKIQAQYFADADVKARFVNVTTRDGIVALNGRVEGENAHQQAVQIAKNTDGVKEVLDHLMVGPIENRSSTADVDAAWVTTKIQARFFADRQINGRRINVTTDRGVVTLSGTVADDRERDRALSIARETSGVTRVDDRLRVDAEADRPVATSGSSGTSAARALDDARITTLVQAKYFLDETVKARHINVDTQQGVVTLRGDVATERERSQAVMLARGTVGVQRVEDNLMIDTSLGR